MTCTAVNWIKMIQSRLKKCAKTNKKLNYFG